MSKEYNLHVDFEDIGYNHKGSFAYVLYKAWTYRHDYSQFKMEITQL